MTQHQLETLELRTLRDATLENGILTIVGTDSPDQINVSLNPANQIVVNLNGSESTFDAAQVNTLTIDARAAADTVAVNVNRPATINGGDGDDSLAGGDAVESFTGGQGNDTVDGNRGNDAADLGAGDDLFIWDPGDGSDIVEGQDGADELQFNGSGGDEIFDVSANGQRARFFRNLGNINMDLNDVERIDLAALGGVDSVTVNDTTGTDLTQVNIDLGRDGAGDSISLKGTGGKDQITLAGDATTGVTVSGLPAQVRLTGSELIDSIRVDGRGQSDRIDASALSAGAARLTLIGNTGHDTLLGGAGDDTLVGGAGNDSADGNRGNDTADLDAGNDSFTWDPGDGSDVVNGAAGFDTLLFNGSGNDEIMAATANGARTTFTRNLGNIVMDVDTEKLDVRALGGGDSVTINDLRSTPTSQVFVDGGDGNDSLTGGPRRDALVGGAGEDSLSGNGDIDVLNGGTGASTDDDAQDRVSGGAHNDFAAFGTGDAFDLGAGSDTLSFIGTNKNDSITVDAIGDSGSPTVAFITSLGTKSAAFANGEIIAVNAGSGDDTVVMTFAAGELWRASFNGGSGNDLLVGGRLDDILNGQSGADTLIGADGEDTLDSGSGRNVLVQ
jgi:Ca2+-binding RTX toxin-like protein